MAALARIASGEHGRIMTDFKDERRGSLAGSSLPGSEPPMLSLPEVNRSGPRPTVLGKEREATIAKSSHDDITMNEDITGEPGSIARLQSAIQGRKDFIMNVNLRRLLTTPVLAGALISAAVLGTPGSASADEWDQWDSSWSHKGAAEVDCSMSASVKSKEIKDVDDELIDEFEDNGNQCGNDVNNKTWNDIYQWGEYAQANAFNVVQNIVQYGLATDDGDVDNRAERNDITVDHFIQANVNVNYNKIKDLDQELVDITVHE